MVQERESSSLMRDERGYLEMEQADKILLACDSPRDRLLILTLIRSGRRISEIVGARGIEPGDIDYKNSMINWNILKKKGSYKSLLPADPYLIAKLQAYILTLRLGYSDKIFPITRQRAFQIVRRLGKRAGITKVGTKSIHPHHFRHTFAVHAARNLESPADLIVLRNQMAHSSVAMTEKYLKFNPEMGKKLLNKMFASDLSASSDAQE